MQKSTYYVNRLPGDQQSTTPGFPVWLVTAILPVLVVVFVAGSLFGLQWAGQRGIVLGYPMPQVQINAASASGSLTLNQNYQFSATASGRDLTYSWDFGDQNTGYGANVSHAYQANGSFTVTVSVTDPAGHRASQSSTYTVLPPLPQATFTFSVGYSGYVYFDASGSTADASTSISRYNWDFGDGSTDMTSSSQDAHSYNSTGTYQVTLTVTDATGQTSSGSTSSVVIS
jgi:PKD repeat protein